MSFHKECIAVIFLGDSPARAFEAGNQINGHYPCQCGIDIRLCKTHANFIQPKYLSIWERNAILNKSDRWLLRRSGELSVFDNMDVSIHFGWKAIPQVFIFLPYLQINFK